MRVKDRPSKEEVEELMSTLNRVQALLEEAARYSSEHHFDGCERTLLHMISHIQTLREGFEDSKPGFAL